jgi:uncharacterized membrane protein
MKKTKLLFYASIAAISAILLFANPFPIAESESQPEAQFEAEIATISTQGSIQEIELKSFEILQPTTKLYEPIFIAHDTAAFLNPRIYQEGDMVTIVKLAEDQFYIQDYSRHRSLIWLFGIFVVIVLIVTRSQGLGALAGMFFSFLVIFRFILPQILHGQDPVLTAITGAALIIPAVFYLSHKLNKKTTIAVVSTLITLVITGIIATLAANASHLTGTASEEASFLSLTAASTIDFQGLVLAGLIISILGILDDITISQASIVYQLKSAKKNIKFKEAYARAMAVGRDHISSLVNTLILVYTGASLPLLLLFLDKSQKFTNILNLEFIAEEIVRTLVGSIGLVLAVPITTVLACIFLTGKEKDCDGQHCHH